MVIEKWFWLKNIVEDLILSVDTVGRAAGVLRETQFHFLELNILFLHLPASKIDRRDRVRDTAH